MQTKLIVAALWIVSVVAAYSAGWFKGVASAPSLAASSATLIGYAALFVVALLLVGGLYLMLRRRNVPHAQVPDDLGRRATV